MRLNNLFHLMCLNEPKKIYYTKVNNHLIYGDEEEDETLSNFPRGLILIKQHFAPF